MSTSEQTTYSSNRPDDRFLSTLGAVHHRLKTGKPRLRFNPHMDAADFPAWQNRVREKLREIMAFPAVTAQPPPVRTGVERRDGYELQRWELFPEPGSVVPVLVLVPDTVSAEDPGPAVLCFPGSASSKELLAGEPEHYPGVQRKFPDHNRMAWWYAQAGMTAVAVENPGTAELADDIRGNVDRQRCCLNVNLIHMGSSYVALSVFQKTRVLDWVRDLTFVDAGRIALSGHSLGTEPAMIMTAVDPAIKALVFNDFLCTNRQRMIVQSRPGDMQRHWVSALWHLVPGLIDWVDFPDILAAIAPRPAIVTEGGPTLDLQRVAKAYSLAGAPRAFQYHYYPKYAKPEDRRDGVPIPEGITQEEYFEYANVDAKNHYFKETLAVPWLEKVLAPGVANGDWGHDGGSGQGQETASCQSRP